MGPFDTSAITNVPSGLSFIVIVTIAIACLLDYDIIKYHMTSHMIYVHTCVSDKSWLNSVTVSSCTINGSSSSGTLSELIIISNVALDEPEIQNNNNNNNNITGMYMYHHLS